MISNFTATPPGFRLLVAYLLVPEEEAPWSEFAPAFIRELLARQVDITTKGGGGGGAAFVWREKPACLHQS